MEPHDGGQKTIGEHRGKGLEDDERESDTIFNANINTSKEAKCWCIANVISTWEIDEREKAKDQEGEWYRVSKGWGITTYEGDIYEDWMDNSESPQNL